MGKKRCEMGAWVHWPTPGIWQVYRRLDVRRREPGSRRDATSTIVFAKRFLTEKFQPSLTQACCDASLVSELPSEDRQKLAKWLEQNPQAIAELSAYEPRPIHSIYNLPIEKPTGVTRPKLMQQLASKKLVETEFEQLLQTHGLSAGYGGWTLQFTSFDYETDSKQYLLYSLTNVLAG